MVAGYWVLVIDGGLWCVTCCPPSSVRVGDKSPTLLNASVTHAGAVHGHSALARVGVGMPTQWLRAQKNRPKAVFVVCEACG